MTVLLPYGRTLSKQLLPRSGPLLTRLTTTHPTLRVSVSNGRDSSSDSSQPSVTRTSVILLPIRTYATATKKAVGRPKGHTGRTTAKRTTKSTTTKKAPLKAAPKKAKAKKAKASAKPKVRAKAAPRKKKELSASAKAKQESKQRRELRERALLTAAPKKLPYTAWMVCFTENGVKKGDPSGTAGTHAKRASQIFKNISLEEHERLNQIANSNKATNEETHRKWLAGFSPIQIKEANNARDQLKRDAKKNGSKKTYPHIQDDRLVKRPTNAYALFLKDRVASGDMNGMKIGELAKLVSREFKDLSTTEKKPYEDKFLADRTRYVEEATSVYGIPPPPRAPSVSA